MKLCDLHTHSVFSDGTDTPEEIVKAAVSLGLSAVALCDHNTVDGLPEFLAAEEYIAWEENVFDEVNKHTCTDDCTDRCTGYHVQNYYIAGNANARFN